jgi:hypothetical protein
MPIRTKWRKGSGITAFDPNPVISNQRRLQCCVGDTKRIQKDLGSRM